MNPAEINARERLKMLLWLKANLLYIPANGRWIEKMISHKTAFCRIFVPKNMIIVVVTATGVAQDESVSVSGESAPVTKKYGDGIGRFCYQTCLQDNLFC